VIELSPSADLDGFFARAMHELKAAAVEIRAYAALMEMQLADADGMQGLRKLARDLRGQADLVAGLVDDGLD
jgi:hypothetical protein